MFGILFEHTYLLVDHLGSGCNATVKLVRHIETGELFARKMNLRSDPHVVSLTFGEIGNTPQISCTTNIHAAYFYPNMPPGDELKTIEDTTTGDAAAGDATAGDTAAGDATAVDTAAEDATAEDTTAEDATAEDATAEDATAEDATAGDTAAGDVTAEDTTKVPATRDDDIVDGNNNNGSNDDSDDDSADDMVPGHFAIYINYVNGGGVDDLVNGLNYFNGQANLPQKLPEHFLWMVLYEMIDVMLKVTSTGVTHNDCHLANWLMRWKDNQDLPDLLLADFGLSDHYERVADILPLISDTGLQAHSNWMLSEDEMIDFRRWHRDVMGDMKQVIGNLMTMIIKPFSAAAERQTSPRFRAALDRYLGALVDDNDLRDVMRDHAQANQPCFGTSAQMIKTLWRMYQATSETLDRQRPLATAAQQQEELRSIRDYAWLQFLFHRAIYRPGERGEIDIEDERPDPPNDIPAHFPTDEELMPLRPEPQYMYGTDNTHLHLWAGTGGLTGDCKFRHGQYEVVDILGRMGKAYACAPVPMRWRGQQHGRSESAESDAIE